MVDLVCQAFAGVVTAFDTNVVITRPITNMFTLHHIAVRRAALIKVMLVAASKRVLVIAIVAGSIPDAAVAAFGCYWHTTSAYALPGPGELDAGRTFCRGFFCLFSGVSLKSDPFRCPHYPSDNLF